MPQHKNTTSTGYSNIILTSHACTRMKERGYCMADINRMIEQNDERLKMLVTTVLPRDTGDTAEQGRLRSAQARLQRAQETLASCTRPKPTRAWTQTVLELERVVHRLSQRGGSATHLADAAARAQPGEMLRNAID